MEPRWTRKNKSSSSSIAPAGLRRRHRQLLRRPRPVGLGNDRCGNCKRFVPTKRVSARCPLGTKGSVRVRFDGRPGALATLTLELSHDLIIARGCEKTGAPGTARRL
jgi:hypothetical protein